MLPTNEFIDLPIETDQFRCSSVHAGESVLICPQEPVTLPSGLFCGDEPPVIPPGVFHAPLRNELA